MTRKRLMVIGLDGAEPSLVFGKLADRLPTLSGLADRGAWGQLLSTVPPVTLPAWTSMFTGLDPGQLGLYGFRNRMDTGYGPLKLASSRSVDSPRVWDHLSRAGLTSYVLGVPGTYPPWPIRGRMVSGFLTPSTSSTFTWPPELKEEIQALCDGYLLDVEGFRTEDKSRLPRQIELMTEKRFRLARAWASEPEWDLLILVEMGPDRMHHAFFRNVDPAHRLHDPHSRYLSTIPDYYAYCDAQIAALARAAGPEVAVLVVSDHGARSMDGGFRINEWLIQQGDLVLLESPSHACGLQSVRVDWSRTRAWGEGGYYGRVFVNLAGREPQGVVLPRKQDAYLQDLAARLERTTDEHGQVLGTRVFFPERIYREVQGIPPDLLVYFGNLGWRSLGEVGTGSIHARSNDTGPDDANHSAEGILIFSTPLAGRGGLITGMAVPEVANLILEFFGLSLPNRQCR